MYPRSGPNNSAIFPALANKGNTVVPIYISQQDTRLRSFSKARYMHISNSQREKMLAAGQIELLDPEQRIYRMTPQASGYGSFLARSAKGSGRVSKAVSSRLQKLLASEITRTPCEEVIYA